MMLLVQNNPAESEAALWKDYVTPATVQVLLLTCHQHLLTVPPSSYRLQRLGALQALLLLLQDRVVAPAHARYCCYILLQLLPDPVLQPYCCVLLKAVLQKLLQAANAPSPLQQQEISSDTAVALLDVLLPPVTAVLVQCLQSTMQQQLLQWQQQIWAEGQDSCQSLAQPFDLPVDHPVIDLLLQLLQQLPSVLQPKLQEVDPLPSIPVLQPVYLLQQQAKQGLGLARQVVMLADTARAMAVASRGRAVAALKCLLQQDDSDIYYQQPAAAAAGTGAGAVAGRRAVLNSGTRVIEFISGEGAVTTGSSYSSSSIGSLGDSSSSSGVGSSKVGVVSQRPVKGEVVAAAWKLADLAAQLGDPDMAAVAGQLLAAAGPLPPHVITFNPPHMVAAAASAATGSTGHAAVAGGGVAKASGKGRKGAAAGTSSSSSSSEVAVLVPQVLKLLCDCLTSVDAHVCATAQSTLKALLATAEGEAAVALVDGSTSSSSKGKSSSSSKPQDGLLQQVLLVFKPSTAASAAAPVNAQSNDVDLEAIGSVDLWSAAGQCYSRWLCRLTSTLLHQCITSPLLQLLAPATALVDSLAELLLPYVVLEMLKNESVPVQTMAVALGKAVHAGVLQPACTFGTTASGSGCSSSSSSSSSVSVSGEGVDVRCVLVVLSVLEQLRIVHRRALMAGRGRIASLIQLWYCTLY
jgi:hypothetical protein